LSGIAEVIGASDKMIDIAIAIDKLDKIGIDSVKNELLNKGLTLGQVEKLNEVIHMHSKYSVIIKIPGSLNPNENVSSSQNVLKLELLKNSEVRNSQKLQKGIEELEFIFNQSAICNLRSAITELDITLARGLNYYTGAIFEVKANAGTLTSSITGGGRYDDLTGVFGLPNVSGVGISFGIDRIFDVMNELNLFDTIDYSSQTTKLLFAHLGEEERNFCIQLAAKTRAAGINTEIYPDVTKKIAKQFDYASKKNIPYMIVVGSNEMKEGKFQLKDGSKNPSEKISIEEIIEKIK
jgi:histidyl-tRNA synthetase